MVDFARPGVEAAKALAQGVALGSGDRRRQPLLEPLAQPATDLSRTDATEVLSARPQEIDRGRVEQRASFGGLRVHQANQTPPDTLLDRPEPAVPGDGRS